MNTGKMLIPRLKRLRFKYVMLLFLYVYLSSMQIFELS